MRRLRKKTCRCSRKHRHAHKHGHVIKRKRTVKRCGGNGVVIARSDGVVQSANDYMESMRIQDEQGLE
jgi:hypothetical protein